MVQRSSLTKTYAISGRPRITILNAKLVDSVLSEIGSRRSLLS